MKQNILGDAELFGENNIELIENQLKNDLLHYIEGKISIHQIELDWSETVGEGRIYKTEDGHWIQALSDIGISSKNNQIKGYGWMDYFLVDNNIQAYWHFLNLNGQALNKEVGIPKHIWDKLPEYLKEQKEFKTRKIPNKPFWIKEKIRKINII